MGSVVAEVDEAEVDRAAVAVEHVVEEDVATSEHDIEIDVPNFHLIIGFDLIFFEFLLPL